MHEFVLREGFASLQCPFESARFSMLFTCDLKHAHIEIETQNSISQ